MNNTVASKVKAKQLLLFDEQYVHAMRLFTQETLRSTKEKNHFESADNIYYIAECLLQLRRLDKVEKVLNKCADFIKLHNRNISIAFKNLQGKYLIEKGKYTACVDLLLPIKKGNTNDSLWCELQITLADAYQRLQIEDKCLMHVQATLQHTKDNFQKARTLNLLGAYYWLLSELDSSKISFEKSYALCLASVGKQHSKSAQLLYNLGLLASRNADYVAAENYYNQSLQIFIDKLGHSHPKTADAYGALGSLFLIEDNPEKARYYSQKEVSIILKNYGNTHPTLAYGYLNLGKIYYLLNDYSKAEKYLNEAISIVQTQYGKQHNLYKQCVVKLAELWTTQKKYEQAKRLLSEAKLLPKDEYTADIFLQIGSTYLAEKSYSLAIEHLKQANTIFEEYYGADNIYATDVQLELSAAYLQNHQIKEATMAANKALSITQAGNKILYPYDNWLCNVQLLECKKAMYKQQAPSLLQIKNDIAIINHAIAVASAIRHTLYTSGSQTYYTEKMAILNELGIYFITKWYKKKDAFFYQQLFYFAENDKANLLRSKIINYENDKILPLAEKKKANLISGKLNYFYTLNEDIAANTSINDSILKYNKQFEQFTHYIEKKYPKIHYLKYGNKNISIEKIQSEIKEDYSFLAYFKDSEDYYCMSISNANVHFMHCGKVEYIDSLVHLFQTAILSKEYDKETAALLSKSILPIGIKKQLIVSPAGELSKVAFDVLQADNRYLIYTHSTQFAFSASTYFLSRNAIFNKNVLGIFPDFTTSNLAVLNTQKEEKAIQLFDEYDLLKDSLITKDNIIKKTQTVGLVHFGTHITIDTVQPLHSMLLLQTKDNYNLCINDIWKLNLNTQLVTLAACQSNFGKQQVGEGIKNFAWAFHYAGARNILSTQWNASDKATATIISDFYSNIRHGESKANAIQNAKLNYLKNTDNIGAQPFFWSNFNLYGDESEIALETPFLANFWWLPLLLSAMLYFGLTRFRRYYKSRRYGY